MTGSEKQIAWAKEIIGKANSMYKESLESSWSAEFIITLSKSTMLSRVVFGYRNTDEVGALKKTIRMAEAKEYNYHNPRATLSVWEILTKLSKPGRSEESRQALLQQLDRVKKLSTV